ncbi:ABC transporter ATP-binding protein [Pseudomonas ovata]|uniref:ABC transporter ATP-binding protein n=1 Tax=Pseudomonas ovata TaxID=1839709 RepID=UPI000D68E2AE|nr:ABC transporter ATP-binding protein [Pseudomonas ovata]
MMLQVDTIEVVYEQAILAVAGVSLKVDEGQVVALLGANGAGKSSTLKAISGLVRAERGEVVQGRVLYQGREVTRRSSQALAGDGLVHVLEGRHCFAHLTVEENLLTGTFAGARLSRRQVSDELARIYAWFPRLKTRRKSLAGYTSGGEQQMIALGRALISRPRLVLLDEPSMGLAPQLVEEIFDIIAALNSREGVSFLLAEQNVNVALRHAHYAYVIEGGRVVDHGEARQMAAREDLHDFYLGSTGTQ